MSIIFGPEAGPSRPRVPGPSGNLASVPGPPPAPGPFLPPIAPAPTTPTTPKGRRRQGPPVSY